MDVNRFVTPEGIRPPWLRKIIRKQSIGLSLAFGLVAVGAMSVASIPAAQAADIVVELTPTVMTYTNTASPTKVYTGYSDTVVSKSQYATYLKFDTSKIAPTATIVSAELQVSVTTSQATTPALWVASVNPLTNFATMTYQGRPALLTGGVNPGESATASAGKTLTTKLTGLAASKPQNWLALRLGYTSSNSATHLSKKMMPVLRVSVRQAPVPSPSASPTASPTASADPTGPGVLNNQRWPDRRVWAHIIPHGLPNYSDLGTGSSNVYGDLYPLDLVNGDWRATPRSTSGVGRALQAGVTGVQILQFGFNHGGDFVTDWMKQADPTWQDADPNNNFMVAPTLEVNTEDDAVRLIQEFAVAAKGHPSAARINGKLVYYTYGTREMSAASWQNVRNRLGSLNSTTFIIADMNTAASQTGYDLRTSYTLPYFKVFDASYDFEDSVDQIWGQLIPHLNQNNRQYAGGFMPGYDRQTCSDDAQCGHLDAFGTSKYRMLWNLSLTSGSTWQNVLTWNDMVERTEVQATSNWSTTRADITAFYSAKLRRLPLPKPRAELYATTPQQIRVGQAVKAEGMVLNGSSSTVTVKTTLLNNQGLPIGKTVVSSVAPGATGDATTSDQDLVTTVPAGGFLRARTQSFDGSGKLIQSVDSAPIVVYSTQANPTKSMYRNYYSIPADHQMLANPAITLSASPVTSSAASATVKPPANISVRFSEVLQNTRQVGNGFATSAYTVHVPMANRAVIGGQVTTASASGFYVGRVIDEQERVGYSDPVFVS